MISEQLRDEAELLHRQFFHHAATDEFVSYYLKAHAEITDLSDANANEIRTVQLIRTRRLDAYGIEPWLRKGTRRHLLTRKLMLVAYLAECDGAHLSCRSVELGRGRAWLTLLVSGASGLIRLLRGRWQKTRYGLV
jgi:hypothetical protein